MRESELPILVIPEILTIFEFDPTRMQQPAFRLINSEVQDWRRGRRKTNPYSDKQKQWLSLHNSEATLTHYVELHRPEMSSALS